MQKICTGLEVQTYRHWFPHICVLWLVIGPKNKDLFQGRWNSLAVSLHGKLNLHYMCCPLAWKEWDGLGGIDRAIGRTAKSSQPAPEEVHIWCKRAIIISVIIINIAKKRSWWWMCTFFPLLFWLVFRHEGIKTFTSRISGSSEMASTADYDENDASMGQAASARRD